MSPPAPFIPDFSEGLETGLYLALLELIDEGLIITGDETIIEANSAACALLERDYRELAGQPLERLFPSGHAFLEARERLLIQGEMRGSLQVALPGGRHRVLRFIAAARLRPGIHAIVLSPDVLAENRPEDEAEAAAAANTAVPTPSFAPPPGNDTLWPRLAAALDQPLLVIDEQQRIHAANTAAVKALGLAREALVGHALSTHFAVEWPAADATPVARLHSRAARGAVLPSRVLEGPRPGWQTLLLPAHNDHFSVALPPRAPLAAADAETLALLRTAVRKRELELHFQPLMDARTARPVGGEALLRWHRPGSGVVPYHGFAELARQHGLLPEMVRWSLTQAISEACHWQAEDAALSVNLSREQALDPALMTHLRTALANTGLAPARLELDFDEALWNEPDVDAVVRAAHELGVRVAIDDFGRGAFPLAALRSTPVHAIKITPALVRGVGYDENSEALVEAICRMAETLGLDVLARGVETQAQQSFLLALGCRLQQGPLFGPPLPGPTFRTYLTPGADAAQ